MTAVHWPTEPVTVEVGKILADFHVDIELNPGHIVTLTRLSATQIAACSQCTWRLYIWSDR
jgi:hypothetical protein